jgi:hypothetical protein
MAEADLAEALEDDLFVLRERLGNDSFPRSAREYLTDWSSPAKGWLRKFYPRGTDEPSYDLVPAVERVIAWLGELEARSFVGTESRLLLLFDLLRQMATGSQSDPEARVAELQKRRDEIDAEIARTLAGDVAVLDDTADPRPLPAIHPHRPRPAFRLPRGRAELPAVRPLGARTHRPLGRWQGRAAR